MPFLTQGKTNWKYILIVVILAVVVGGGTLWCMMKQEILPYPFKKIEILKQDEKYCKQDKDCTGVCPWDCINKSYFLTEKHYCRAKPLCGCVDSQCVRIHTEYGHSGMLEIIFAPAVMTEDTPNETKEKVTQFVNNLGIEVVNLNDVNIIRSITIYREGITEDLMKEIKTDSLVKEFKEWAQLERGLTYLIVFQEGLYKEELRKFVDKYPKVEDNLVGNEFLIPLQPIIVTVSGVPVGRENEYIQEFKTEYPNEIIEIERLPFE